MPRPTLPLRVIALAALGACALPAAVAQPDADALLRRWSADLRAVLEAVDGVRYTETMTREVEGASHVRRLRTVHRVTSARGHPDRRLLSAEVDGTPAGPEEVEAFEERLRRALGPEFVRAERAASLPLRTLTTFEPVGRPAPDAVAGVPAWRVELRPSPERPRRRPRPEGRHHPPARPIEHATVWFTRSEARPLLLRTQLHVLGAEPDAALALTTDYRTFRGPAGALPVLHRQRVEGAIVQQRRWRTFTVLFRAEREVDDVRVTWRRDR
jgi:hypothetical protein